MAKNHEINVKVNAKGTKDADKAFKDINKGLKDIETQAKKSFSADNVKKVNQEIKNTTKVTLDVRQRLRDLQNKMAEIGDVGSAEFQQLAKEAGTLKDQMNNANAAIKSMSADFPRLQVGVEAIGAMGAGAQVATASMALFGGENEAVTRSIQKMMAIQAVMNASLQLSNMLSDESAIGLAIRKLRTEALTKSNGKNVKGMMAEIIIQRGLNGVKKASIATMKALNNVMRANPVLLLVTAIGGLVAVLKIFTSASQKAKDVQDELNASYEKQQGVLSDIKAELKDKRDFILRTAKVEGKTDKEIYELKKKLRKNEDDERKVDMKAIENRNKQLRLMNTLHRKEGNDELLKANKKEIRDNKSKYKQLVRNKEDYLLDIKEMDKAEADRIEAKNDKTVAENKAKWQKILAKRKEVANFRKQTEDMELANREKTLNNELSAQMIKFKREEEELQKNLDSKKITQEMFDSRKLALEEKYRLERNGIVKRYDDQEKSLLEASRKEKEIKDKEQADLKRRAEELRINRIADDRQRELALENLAYQKKIESARGHKDLLAELELQHNAKIKEINDTHDNEIILKKEENFRKQASAMAFFAQQAHAGLTSIAQLDGVLMQNKLNAVKGNTQAEEKLRKESFKRQKALNISLAIIDGFRAINSSIASSPLTVMGVPNPGAITALAITSLTSAMNIAKIASTKYQGGSTSRPSTPSVGGGQSPQFNVVGNSPQNQLAQSLGESNDEPVQAFVVSTEVTSAQSMDRNIVETASF